MLFPSHDLHIAAPLLSRVSDLRNKWISFIAITCVHEVLMRARPSGWMIIISPTEGSAWCTKTRFWIEWVVVRDDGKKTFGWFIFSIALFLREAAHCHFTVMLLEWLAPLELRATQGLPSACGGSFSEVSDDSLFTVHVQKGSSMYNNALIYNREPNQHSID